MFIRRSVLAGAVKTVIALGAILTLLVIAGHDLFPTTPLQEILIKAAVLLGLVSLVLLVAVLVGATFSQFLLRQGATDLQWLWFRAEPPGLLKLRAEVKAEQAREP